MKELNSDKLKQLRGGDGNLILCCVYFVDTGELAYSGYSGNGSCDFIPLPAGMYAEECPED